jgi:hypothetical protein
MQSMTYAARTRRRYSRHERQRHARAEAFSRRTRNMPATPPPVRLEPEVIGRLVRRDRTAVSTALLAVAGIGAGEVMRRAVLASVSEAAGWAQAEGAISASRAEQITRHVKRALGDCEHAVEA